MYNEDRSRNEKAYTFFKEEDTMKKKIIAGCLLAALACSMIGCGKKKETNAPAQVDETSRMRKAPKKIQRRMTPARIPPRPSRIMTKRLSLS